jgi:hypothetical protein
MNEKNVELLISIVVFREKDQFIAQGLEHDICVQASNMPNLRKRFERVALSSFLACEQEGLDFAMSFPPAPRELWDEGRLPHFVGPIEKLLIVVTGFPSHSGRDQP